ncbi:MAG: iron ABC transporter permease [Bacteroides sp.]|nr:iron ABC transporter permease [Lachnospiraceae bacterium]MCM1332225.1 iron ABC transporter permease [Bacteroides sp.]MCM1389242.1 iron ABC transporter permease [Bacteroides sp.]
MIRFVILIVGIAVLFVLNLFIGSVSIPCADVWMVLTGNADPGSTTSFIVLGSRLPQAITALLAGAGLAVSGLMLQTAFRNPLAGPSILGITSGASLGVALVMLLLGGTIVAGNFAWNGYAAIITGAFVGSLSIMGVLLLFSTWLKNDLMLLISGIMIGYMTSSAITLLNFSSTAQGVHSYTMWGMGTFNAVSMDRMPLFAAITCAGILMAVLLIKPLNLLLLGNNYAINLGLNVKSVRNRLLLATGILTAVITAYCGPVSFIGLAVPHIARMIFRSDNHRILLPATLVCGSIVALLCNLITVLPESGVIPLNAVTPLIGAPVIIYVIIRRRR